MDSRYLLNTSGWAEESDDDEVNIVTILTDDTIVHSDGDRIRTTDPQKSGVSRRTRREKRRGTNARTNRGTDGQSVRTNTGTNARTNRGTDGRNRQTKKRSSNGRKTDITNGTKMDRVEWKYPKIDSTVKRQFPIRS